jgi:hypothetical protein
MARRINNSEVMGAFRRRQHDIIEANITILAKRYCGVIHAELMPSDLLEMFVKPDQRAAAKAAYKEFSVNTMDVVDVPIKVSEGEVMVVVEPSTDLKWAMPRNFAARHKGYNVPGYINTGCEGYRKLYEWVQWRVEQGTKWGLVMAVYQTLLHKCQDARTLRYLWPAVVPLLGSDDMANKLRVAKEPARIPELSLELRRAMAEANSLVAGTLMLPKPVTTEGSVEVRLPTYPTGSAPWNSQVKLPAL